MFERRKTTLLCAICRGGLGACVRRHATGAHRRGSERRTLPPGLENSGLLFTRPRVLLRARFFPHAKTYPRPHRGRGTWGAYSWAGNLVHTRQRIFSGENPPGRSHYARTGAPRMRAYLADEMPTCHTRLRSWQRSPVRLPHNGNNPTRQGARGGVYARRHIAQEAAAIPGAAIVSDSGTSTPWKMAASGCSWPCRFSVLRGKCAQFGRGCRKQETPPQLFPRVAAIRLLT